MIEFSDMNISHGKIWNETVLHSSWDSNKRAVLRDLLDNCQGIACHCLDRYFRLYYIASLQCNYRTRWLDKCRTMDKIICRTKQMQAKEKSTLKKREREYLVVDWLHVKLCRFLRQCMHLNANTFSVFGFVSVVVFLLLIHKLEHDMFAVIHLWKTLRTSNSKLQPILFNVHILHMDQIFQTLNGWTLIKWPGCLCLLIVMTAP